MLEIVKSMSELDSHASPPKSTAFPYTHSHTPFFPLSPTFQGMLEIVSSASEFDTMPLRPGEEESVRKLLAHAPVTVEQVRVGACGPLQSACLDAYALVTVKSVRMGATVVMLCKPLFAGTSLSGCARASLKGRKGFGMVLTGDGLRFSLHIMYCLF